MDGLTIDQRYGYIADTLAQYVHTGWEKIDETNVYQERNAALYAILHTMVQEYMLPNSRLEGQEHFLSFIEQVRAGKKGIILMEHYSNLDLPIFASLLEHADEPAIREIPERLVAIAGMKLNEEHSMIRALAQAFTRIVIYPNRTLDTIDDPTVRAQEELRCRIINRAAMRVLHTVRQQGKIVLVFPSGTRYRPGNPETKQAVREIDSYLRIFDIVIFVSINGCCLRIDMSKAHEMIADKLYRDTVIVASSPVFECADFRKETIESTGTSDPQQAIAQRITALLETQHTQYEQLRLSITH
ncbi:MAG: 1-acyl-sn-glycerol-3-phosphate acyltransferase [Treponema sp.]|jgi:glycerol-3-phosphate O-acyltransferase|nr:1-acyl-sn-glycerol-3-phosphate acyltransferase [Treponema sp.]